VKKSALQWKKYSYPKRRENPGDLGCLRGTCFDEGPSKSINLISQLALATSHSKSRFEVAWLRSPGFKLLSSIEISIAVEKIFLPKTQRKSRGSGVFEGYLFCMA